MSELRVAVLGDSAVWGQGLHPDAKFATIAAREIAERAGRDPVITPFTARSGAKIVAAEQDGTERVALPSGAQLSVAPGDRLRFYDVYPAFFDTDEETRAFFAGTNEEMALDLFGDVPATFPTITYQVRRVRDAIGRDIELVIVDGSINDIDIREVLDPEGAELEDLAQAIRRFAFDELKTLLVSVRAKFPRAVIVATGYYSPFSADSDRDELEAFVKFISGKAEWALAFNDFLTSLPLSLLGKDVDELVEELIERSDFAHRRGLFWLRRAVAELNETATAGPGLIFAHPGFRPENSAFASGTTLVHEGYKLPGAGDHEVRDAVLEQRRRAIPRERHLGALRVAAHYLLLLHGRQQPPGLRLERLLEQLANLRGELDGPTSLRQLLDAVVTAPAELRSVAAHEARLAVEAEIGRIEVSTIASLVHPNEAGARRYADVIVDRHTRQARGSARSDLQRLAGGGPISVRGSFRRYGFSAGIGLRAFMQHMLVDTLAVEMAARSLTPLLPFPVLLVTGGGRTFQLDNPLGGLSVVDTLGRLHLGDISGLALEIGGGVPGKLEVEDFRFMINGRTVFRSAGSAVLAGGAPLSFPYPTRVGYEMASLRTAFEQLEVSAEDGLRSALPVRPPSLRELIRVATLPRPRLADVGPDDPVAFESFEVEDPQGIVHAGGDRWFLSSQFTVRLCTIEGDDPFQPAGVRHDNSRNLFELLQEAGLARGPVLVDFDHIGDLGFAEPIVYVPVRRTDGKGANLMMGLSADLRVVGWAELAATTGESTCAINPWNGLLYVPDRGDSGRLEAYGVSAFTERFEQRSQWGRRLDVARTQRADIQLRTPEGEKDREGMQSVAFSANGRVYVTRSGDEPYINRIFVYRALTGRRFGAERIWDFPGDGDEIQGIEVHPSGVLYVSVNDNDAERPPFNQDDFDLYTFRFGTLDASEV